MRVYILSMFITTAAIARDCLRLCIPRRVEEEEGKKFVFLWLKIEQWNELIF